MTTPETTPAKLNALAADAELYGEGCREYARGLRAAAIELEGAIKDVSDYRAALEFAEAREEAALKKLRDLEQRHD